MIERLIRILIFDKTAVSQKKSFYANKLHFALKSRHYYQKSYFSDHYLTNTYIWCVKFSKLSVQPKEQIGEIFGSRLH